MMQKLSVLILILLAISCKKEAFDIKNLNGNKIGAIGHGGMGNGHPYPQNSYESILNCINLDSDGVEIDVQITKDSVLVAYHDERLEDNTSSSGYIRDKTWSELEDVVYKFPFHLKYQLINLDQLFSTLKFSPHQHFFIDSKGFEDTESSRRTFCHAVIRLIEKYNLNGHIYLQTSNIDLMILFQNKKPDLPIFICSDMDTGIEIAKQYNLIGVSSEEDKVSKEAVERAHSKGLMVNVFDLGSHEENKRAIRKNVDFIQSDDIKNLISLLK